MDARIDGNCKIEYRNARTGLIERSRKLTGVELVYDPQQAKVAIESNLTHLYLPASAGTITCAVSGKLRDGVTLRTSTITLFLSGSLPGAASLFTRCVLESRQWSRAEADGVRREKSRARTGGGDGDGEETGGNSSLNLAAGFTVATQFRGSEIIRRAPPTTTSSSGSGQAAVEAVSASLTQEQAAVLEAVRTGRSVFFTGSAGTGKSLVLRALKRSLPVDSTHFTATTGVAACAIGGSTLHAWAGLGKDVLASIEAMQIPTAAAPSDKVNRSREGDDRSSVASGASGRTAGAASCASAAACRVPPALLRAAVEAVCGRSEARIRWRTTRVLVVDEVSMLDGDTFDVLDAVGRAVRGVPHLPWGGLQLVLTGDFFQLPPVGARGRPKKHAFQALGWEASVPCCIELTEVFRQADPVFAALLNEARWGTVSEASTALLRSRWAAVLPPGLDVIVPTKLHTHRGDVEAENREELSRLQGEAKVYRAMDSTDKGNPAHLRLLESGCPAPAELTLKIGAQVILLKTLDASAGLVNGARGVVTGFTGTGPTPTPTVKFVCGAEVTVRPEAWPVSSGGRVLASRRQMPLALAWALSIHKSQGMSLDAVVMDLSKCFEAGQAYVALSRARSLEGLSFKTGFEPGVVKAAPAVKEFYLRLRARQQAGAGAVESAGGSWKAAAPAAGNTLSSLSTKSAPAPVAQALPSGTTPLAATAHVWRGTPASLPVEWPDMPPPPPAPTKGPAAAAGTPVARQASLSSFFKSKAEKQLPSAAQAADTAAVPAPGSHSTAVLPPAPSSPAHVPAHARSVLSGAVGKSSTPVSGTGSGRRRARAEALGPPSPVKASVMQGWVSPSKRLDGLPLSVASPATVNATASRTHRSPPVCPPLTAMTTGGETSPAKARPGINSSPGAAPVSPATVRSPAAKLAYRPTG